jgi:hypothetical protein
MEIDIRNTNFTVIKFAEYAAIHKSDEVSLVVGEVSEQLEVVISNKDDALNLIKALEKAIELKWFDK